jgi:hypothetical protein
MLLGARMSCEATSPRINGYDEGRIAIGVTMIAKQVNPEMINSSNPIYDDSIFINLLGVSLPPLVMEGCLFLECLANQFTDYFA